MTSITASASAPAPTKKLDQGLADLAEFGACIITDVLDATAVAEVRAVLYRAADNDRKHGRHQLYGYGGDDTINQRVWNLPSRDPLFCDLVEHPLAIELVKHVLGWPASMSSMAANITGPGGSRMMLHADQGYVPKPWAQPWVLNIGWCVDDFTAENGATLFAPGSHLHNGVVPGGEQSLPLVPAEAPAGSIIVMDGRIWHTSGENRSADRRAGIFSVYTLPILLRQENHFLSLDPAIRQFGSETLQTLFGFRPQVLGRVNGLERI